MTPTIDPTQLSMEQLTALQQLLHHQIQMTTNRPEPVDANVIPNPNLGKRIPYPKMIYNHQSRQTLIVKDEREHQAAEEQGYVTEPFFDEPVTAPKVKSPGFEDESGDAAELRELIAQQQAVLEQQQEQIQALMARKPMNRRSGE